MKPKRGMVFGVFDGLHEGHKRFLNDARERCEKLFVVVARDTHTVVRKGKPPRQTEVERMKQLAEFLPDSLVLLGDSEEGTWHVIDEHDPERVFLGYDQSVMARELKTMGIPFTLLDAYEPEKYKSSLI